MKKYVSLYVSLFVLLIFSFWGCSMISPAIRINNAIERVGHAYGITKDVSVTIVGNYADDIKDVFKDFGFSIVENKADYLVRIKVQSLGTGRSLMYYVYPATIRLTIIDNRTKKEYYYKADGEFKFRAQYGGGSYSIYHHPNNFYGMAAKIATPEAIGHFMDECNIPHRRPKKKKK